MEKKKSNGKGKVGSVEVSLTREDFNSLVKLLDEFLEAGSDNKYAVYAANLKEKMLRHSRRYTHKNENKTVTYFYEVEAALMIKLIAFYANAIGISGEDYYEKIGKGREKNADDLETENEPDIA